MTRTRTLTTLALAAALSPLLAACSDDAASAPPAPSPTTSAATSAPPSPTPTLDLSVAPPGETAQEFIKRWIELGNRMQATGDTTDVLAVSGPDCSSCRGFATSVERIYADGGHIEGGSDTVVSLKPESETQWVVNLRGQPTRVLGRSGQETDRLTGGLYTVRLYLAKVNGRWLVGESSRSPE